MGGGGFTAWGPGGGELTNKLGTVDPECVLEEG